MLVEKAIHTFKVLHNDSHSWTHLLRVGTPDTPEWYDVYRAEKSMYSMTSGSGEREVSIVYFGEAAETEELMLWARSKNLGPVHPRLNLCLAHHYPQLPTLLGLQSVGVAALVPIWFNEKWVANTIWWYGHKDRPHDRTAFFADYGEKKWSKDYWFSFAEPLFDL